MVGFRNDHGTYPHLDIRVEGSLRNLDEDGEECWPEETELEGDLNFVREVDDIEDLELEDEESYSLDELFAMTDLNDEGARSINYDEYYKSFDADWLYQNQEACIESAEADENEEGLGRPTSGARYRQRLHGTAIGLKTTRAGKNVHAHGTHPAWQKFGGGKRGRQSIRFATPLQPEPFRFEDHFDLRASRELYAQWQEEHAAYEYIRAALQEFVEFDDQPVRRAA